MANKLLTLDDLYSYYSTNFKRKTHFSANKNGGKPIVVQVDGSMIFEKSEDNIEGLKPVVLQSCHIGKNLNRSNITKENMEKALPSFQNRPILGYIHEVDGQLEFYGHNMHLDDDDNIVYDEIPVGVVPESCNARLEYDEEKDKTYVVVNGYIFEEYTKAAEILEREQECAVSIELSIRELSYNAKDKYLDLEDFFFSGVTILGKTPEGEKVKPGMEGSNIKLSDFSADNNSVFSHIDINEQKLIELLDRLNTTLSNFNIDDKSKEGGQNMDKKFEELLEKYSKTKDDVDLDYSEMTEEELEAKFEELFGEEASSDDEASTSTDEDIEDVGDEAEDGNDDSDDEGDNAGDGDQQFSNKFSVEFNGKVRAFELALDDKIYALSELVNDTYGEEDNTWYGVKVYEHYLIMIDYWSDIAYKQSYKQEGESFSLNGERVQVYANWLTAEEELALKEMRSNYSAIKDELGKYKKAEENAEKDKIFADEDYAQFMDTEEFKALVKDKDNYSVDELKDKAAIAFAKCVKQKGVFAAAEPKLNTKRKQFAYAKPENKKRPYGNIFKTK